MTRFQSPVSTPRPRGSRVVEAFSPKLGRRLQCFGHRACDQWILLEADPAVRTFCERPVQVDTPYGNLVPDYWVRLQDEEIFVNVGDEISVSSITIGDTEIPIRRTPFIALAAARIWIENWERMLPAVSTCRELISSSFSNSVLKYVSESMQLSRIEREFEIGDPTLVRATVFSLLHRGQLQAPQLKTEPLSMLTCFEPVEAMP